MLVPSCALRRSTAFLSDRGNRKGYVSFMTSSLIFERSQGFAWKQDFNAESRRGASEIPEIKSDQHAGLPVNRRFEHHLVVGIVKLRPPQEVRLYRFGQR